jgi:polyferredoxin
LIRYSSRELLEGHTRHIVRPRTVLYPVALVVFLGGFIYALMNRDAADVTVLGGQGEPFTQQSDGRIANQVRVKIANRTNVDHDYRIEVVGAESGSVIVPQNPLRVPTGQSAVTPLFILLPRGAFHDGEHRVTVRVSDGNGFSIDTPYRLVGPEHDDDDDHDRTRRDR